MSFNTEDLSSFGVSNQLISLTSREFSNWKILTSFEPSSIISSFQSINFPNE